MQRWNFTVQRGPFHAMACSRTVTSSSGHSNSSTSTATSTATISGDADDDDDDGDNGAIGDLSNPSDRSIFGLSVMTVAIFALCVYVVAKRYCTSKYNVA